MTRRVRLACLSAHPPRSRVGRAALPLAVGRRVDQVRAGCGVRFKYMYQAWNACTRSKGRASSLSTGTPR
jgi:hypothetical protein